jgi:hypothetical protein
MSGLETLAYALSVTIALMAAIFVLSRILLHYGLFPLAAAFSVSGFNMFLLYLLVFPGTVIHELSHYLACVFTGVQVRQVRLFSPQKNGALGWVLSAQSDPLRRTLIALAPFIGGSLAIYALVRFGLPAGQLDPLAVVPGDLVEGFRSSLESMAATLRQADLHQATTWLVLYVLFSLGFAVAPSTEDLAPLATYAALTLLLLIAVSAADQHYGWGLAQSSLLNGAALFLTRVFERLNALLLFGAAVVALGTLIIVPFALIALWIRGALLSR